ncbi:MAG: hypothetical protein Q9167_001290 [Letrouitia subvulpina]
MTRPSFSLFYDQCTEKKRRFQTDKPLDNTLRFIKSQLPPLNFITLHYYYFIGTCLLASVIFWGSSTPARSISYTDSLFCVVSAMTLAGLNSINLSQMNTFQQFILFLLLMLGSAIFVSMAVVFVRLKAFEKKFTHIVEEQRQKRRDRGGGLRKRLTMVSRPSKQTGSEVNGGVLKGRSTTSATHPEQSMDVDDLEKGGKVTPIPKESIDRSDGQKLANGLRLDTRVHPNEVQPDDAATPVSPNGGIARRGRVVTFIPSPTSTSPPKIAPLRQIFSMQGVGARHDLPNRPRHIAEVLVAPQTLPNQDKSWEDYLMHRFNIPGLLGRNSQFSKLTLKERERIGGIEWRALVVLAVVVPLYFISWQFLAAIGMGAWVANHGRNLTQANGYPVFLRLILWTFWVVCKSLPESEKCKEYTVTLRFLLDHPRRCYTNLFPSRHTWWLLATLFALNGIDWIGFEVLNIGNDRLNNSLSPGTRAVDGFFQSLAVRSGGFYVVTIAYLRIGLLILYAIMMYVSVYPVVITMRNSNVYEERSLGIFSEARPSDDQQEDQTTIKRSNSKKETLIKELKRRVTYQPPCTDPTETRGYFVRQQIRGQLAHDLWWVVVAVLLISIIETSQFERDPVTYSVFNIIFEVISGYGCVGLSVGLPDQAYSFSGGWHKLSKMLLCAVMIRGRHRGLPVAIDRAVLLPGDHLKIMEEEDADRRLKRSGTRLSA